MSGPGFAIAILVFCATVLAIGWLGMFVLGVSIALVGWIYVCICELEP